MHTFDITQPPPSQSRIDAMRYAAHAWVGFMWFVVVLSGAGTAWFALLVSSMPRSEFEFAFFCVMVIAAWFYFADSLRGLPGFHKQRGPELLWKQRLISFIYGLGTLGLLIVNMAFFIALQSGDTSWLAAEWDLESFIHAEITVLGLFALFWLITILGAILQSSVIGPAYYRLASLQPPRRYTAPQAIAYHEAVVAMGRPLAAGEVEALLKAEQPDEARAAGAVGNKPPIPANDS